MNLDEASSVVSENTLFSLFFFLFVFSYFPSLLLLFYLVFICLGVFFYGLLLLLVFSLSLFQFLLWVIILQGDMCGEEGRGEGGKEGENVYQQ